MFRSIVIFLILCLAVMPALAQWVGLTSSQPQPMTSRVLDNGMSSTVLEFTVAGYNLETIDIDGKAYSVISVPEGFPITQEGYPELPTTCTSIVIPDDAKMSYEILQAEYETITLAPVKPSKGDLPIDINPDDVPYTFSKVYKKNKLWPQEVVELSNPYILRDIRGLTVHCNLFRTNAARSQLVVCKRLVVRVYADGISTVNVKKRRTSKVNTAFEGIYSRQFVNYSGSNISSDKIMTAEAAIMDYNSLPGISSEARMLIIAADNFYDNMIPLRNWRTQRGLKAELVKCSSIGVTADDIKARIQYEYDNNNLLYVLLVGDGHPDGIPSISVPTPLLNIPGNPFFPDCTNVAASDPEYSRVDGIDYYPDIFVSRFSAETDDDVNNMVNRTIQYETNPPTGDWYKKATFIADDEVNGFDGMTSAEIMELNRADLEGYGYTQIDALYGWDIIPSQVSNAINDGRNLILYNGHGCWGISYFSNWHINGLNSTGMLPFIISGGCGCGSFNSPPTATSPMCFAEAWMRAGTAEEPKGAIGVCMASCSMGWHPQEIAQAEAVDLITTGNQYTLGELFFNSKCAMLEFYDNNAPYFIGVYTSQIWHLFGDAAVPMWTRIDGPLTFTSANVTYDANSVTVDAGVADATICVSSENNGFFFWECQNDVNSYTFNTCVRPLYVTVTKDNYIPYTEYIPFVPGPTTVTQVPVNAGWNCVSVPRIQTDYSTDAVFPGSVQVYVFNTKTGYYDMVTTTENGPGYFTYFASPATLSISGSPTGDQTVSVEKAGWALIGSRSTPVPISSLVLSNGGSITQAMWYNPFSYAYEFITEIQPGTAVWVSVQGATSWPCTVTIPAP